MFSGIISTLGTVEKRTATTLLVKSKLPRQKLGASVAVNGVCLTVTKARNGINHFDVGPDTWARTNLGALDKGDRVNLEPSLKLGDEISGHFVAGHVDAVSEILSLEPWDGEFIRFKARLPRELQGLIAVKGSIAVDGISLTVTSVDQDSFEIMLVPHTLKVTTLGRREAGERVNLEADPLARYARAAVAALGAR